MAENRILIEEEEDRENFPPATTPVSGRPTQSPVLMRSRPFGTRLEKVPDCFYRNLLEIFISILLCLYFNMNYN